jgi:hypothetical protein
MIGPEKIPTPVTLKVQTADLVQVLKWSLKINVADSKGYALNIMWLCYN